MSAKKSLDKKSPNSTRTPRTRTRLTFSRRERERTRERTPESASPDSTSRVVRGGARNRGRRRRPPSELAVLSARLTRAETLLAAVEEFAELGTWEVDPSARSFCYSENLARMLGLPAPSGPLPIAALAASLEPVDPSSITARVAEVLNSGASSIQFSEPSPFGGSRNRRTLFLPLSSVGSSTSRVLGISQDISAACSAEDEVRRLSHLLLSAQSEEQRRLSRNLHETVSQTLAAIKLTLGKIARSLPDQDAGAARGVESARDLVEDAIREVRSVSALLHPPLLEEAGLRATLRGYSRAFSERSGLRVLLNCSAVVARMSCEIELALFRVVQESLTNVHRHAKARRVLILVKQSHRLVTVEIRDDGIGLGHREGSRAPIVPYGVGIAGMQERVQQLNGTFRIHGIRGGGTVVSVSLPITIQSETSARRS